MLDVLRVDATEFKKNIGDEVKKGELLGYSKNIPISAKIDGKIKCIYFDEDSHELEIVISEE